MLPSTEEKKNYNDLIHFRLPWKKISCNKNNDDDKLLSSEIMKFKIISQQTVFKKLN